MTRDRQAPQGPLVGITVIEMGGIGPAPFCGQLLADFGAEVIVIDRKRDVVTEQRPVNMFMRGKRSVCLDAHEPAQLETLRALIKRADVLIDPFRPGVMERLGLGPEVCLADNAALVFARMTGWGQSGPYAQAAGHDINYIALTGALHANGSADRPPMPPLNIVGDYGGGAMFLAFGIVSAVLEARQSGKGQVVDAAICDATSYLMAFTYALHHLGFWREEREANLLDGATPYYRTYRTRDDKFVALGAIEDRFYDELLDRLKIDGAEIGDRRDRANWSRLEQRFTETFAQRTRAEWESVLGGSDACFAPVLTYLEAVDHPHNVARRNFVAVDGLTEPAPAPRFSRTPGNVRSGAPFSGEDTTSVLHAMLGLSADVATDANSG